MNIVIGLLLFSSVYALSLFFKRSIILKFFTITILFAVSSIAYFSFETYKGWPTKQRPPKSFVYDIQVVQPNKTFPGAIYVWAVPMEQKQLTYIEKIIQYTFDIPNAPRAYYIPYTNQGNKAFGEAQKKLREGNVVIMEGGQGEGEGIGSGKKNGVKDKNSGDARDYDVPSLIIISPDNMIRKD